MKRRDYKNILIVMAIGLIIILGVYLCGNIFGANMDFINQHTVIPEYFRNYFYETKKLIPDIIFNLGLGENAFNFSYYGLLNPIILISYLLPFVSMTTYIIISSIILYLLSILLFYKWINTKFDSNKTFLLTLLFGCASPLLFQFHRQIMFVNYFPFLLLALINIDNFDIKKHKIFLVINLFLMLMTSFYFAIGGIIVILIYFFYKNFNKKLIDKIKVFIPIIISILLASILLIPSLGAILNNRGVGNSTDIINLLIPNFNYSRVLYGSYALGLFSISIVSLIYLLIGKNKDKKFLSITLFILITCPIIIYILNGGLYVRSKVLIPFLPLFILVIGLFLNDLFNNKVKYKSLFIGISILFILSLINFNLLYSIDLLITAFIIFIYSKYKDERIVIIPLILLSLFTIIYCNIDEEYITRNEYKDIFKNEENIENILNGDNSIYRFSNLNDTLYNVNRRFSTNMYKTSIYSSTINNNYSNFYYNILKMNNNNYNNLIIRDSSNIILNSLLGVKYVSSEKELGNGYSLIFNNIYQNNYALPIGYASNNIYSAYKFINSTYPYNLKYLLNGIVVDGNYSTDTPDIIEEISYDIPNYLGDFISINKKDDYYEVTVSEESSFVMSLNEQLDNKLLFITINGLESNSCKIDDIGISINGIENTLSCDKWLYNNQNTTFNYLINENNLSDLNIIIKPGVYKITNINMYTMDINYLDNDFDLMTNINIEDNVLSGSIDITESSFMTLSIPYDKGFHVFIDDKETSFEKVNDSFIGFPIDEGNHSIKAVYNSPYLKLGKLVSLCGLLSLVIYSCLLNKNVLRFKR